MERELALEFSRVTEAAALASSRWMGRGDRDAADNAAVRAMRAVFDTVNIAGTVVIGEGERDEAPMLYIGEKVGMGKSPVVDVAVDPLEGTNIVAKGLTGSISVLAVAPKDCLLHAPDIYMDKIAVGPRAKGKIDLDAPVADNLKSVSEALCKSIDDLTVVILDRPRHKQLIKDVREAGARIRLISDGDVSPAVATAYEDSGVDLMMGIGGAPEGVLAAAALVCLGGDMQARLAPENDEDRKRIHQMGTVDEDKLLMLDDLVKGDDVIFVATGITDGSLLKGVRYRVGGASTYTIVMRSQTGTVRYIEAWHKFAKKPLIDKIQGSCD